jgi:hypothetical protein
MAQLNSELQQAVQSPGKDKIPPDKKTEKGTK